MKSLNLQILPQHFFLQCFKCWGFASNLNKPSAFTTSAATSSSSSIAPLYVLSSSICASAPECKSHSHSQRRQKGKRSQYLWQGGDVSPYFTSDSIHSELLTFPRLSLLSCFFGGAIDGFTLDLKSVRLGCWLQGGELSAVAAFVLYNYKKEKGGCLLCTSFVNFASCPHWLSVRLCVAQKGQWSSHYFLLLSFLRSQGYCLGWLMRESRWCFLFFASAVISASMNRATCLLWRRRWINYLKDTTSDWGRTLEVCSAFIPQLYFWRHLQCCGQT